MWLSVYPSVSVSVSGRMPRIRNLEYKNLHENEYENEYERECCMNANAKHVSKFAIECGSRLMHAI